MPLFLTIENKLMYHNTWHSNGDIYHMYTRCDELCATAKVVAFYCGMQPTYSKYGLSLHSVSFHFHFASLFRLHRKTEADGKKTSKNANILKIDGGGGGSGSSVRDVDVCHIVYVRVYKYAVYMQ